MNPLLPSKFETIFHAPVPIHVHAPGRVNLIGEHTDYNDGYVLPMAVERCVQIALRPRNDQLVVLHSIEYDETVEFNLGQLHHGGPAWSEDIKGVAWAMQVNGLHPTGWEGVMTGDIPSGAGLSSSAAVEIAAGRAFAAVSGLDLDPIKLAELGRKAENDWVGVHCGIMDQMASSVASPGHALFLDCRNLSYAHVPLPPGVSIAIMDTATRRGLVDSAYNERRFQCETAAHAFGVRALRDVEEAELRSQAAQMDGVKWRRAKHVVSENSRVLQAVEAMRKGDTGLLGKLLDASHISLRDDFEVSSEALNTIVEIAQLQQGCYGARMTGAGFGGCAVALIDNHVIEAFSHAVVQRYQQETGLHPAVYITRASKGANTTRLTI